MLYNLQYLCEIFSGCSSLKQVQIEEYNLNADKEISVNIQCEQEMMQYFFQFSV